MVNDNIDGNIIQENEAQSPQITKPPWDPKSFTWLALLFSFCASGILAGLNWKRLGKPRYTWFTIFLSIFGLMCFVFIASISQMSEFISYGINIAIGGFFACWQKNAYEQWIAIHGSPSKIESGYLIPGAVCTVSIILVFLFVYIAAFIQNIDIQLERVADNKYVIETLAQSDEEVAGLNKDEAPYFISGYEHYEKGEFRDAIIDLTKAIKINPDNANYLFRGTCYLAVREFKNALADFDRAIDLDQNSSDAYHNRCIVYNCTEEYDKALADVNRAIELNTAHNIYYSSRGLVFANLKNFELALTDFNHSIQLDPNYDPVYLSRGMLYYDMNERVKAIADFKKAVELNSDNLLFLNEIKKRYPDFNIRSE